jgi:hypothetical protein
MATIHIYTSPGAELAYVGDGQARLSPTPSGLNLLFDSRERTVSIHLETNDLKTLLVDLSTCIIAHKKSIDSTRP